MVAVLKNLIIIIFNSYDEGFRKLKQPVLSTTVRLTLSGLHVWK